MSWGGRWGGAELATPPACRRANRASPPAACLLRSNALSLVYLLFLLLLPWFAGPSHHSIRGKGQAVAPAWRRGTRGSELFVTCTRLGHVGGVRWVLPRNRGQRGISLWFNSHK